MPDKTLKIIIAAIISLLIIHQVGTLITGIFGMAWGFAASMFVAVVSFLSVRLAKAGGRGSMWFLLPTLLFTIIPITVMLWRLFTHDASWLGRLTSIGPFFIGFGFPILLLLMVYYELRKRTREG